MTGIEPAYSAREHERPTTMAALTSGDGVLGDAVIDPG
jgi:hypothetical protein